MIARLSKTTALASVLILCAGSTQAARLPAWAESVAASAPEIKASPDNDPWLVLLYSMSTEVRPNGTLNIRYRTVRQALTVRVDADSEGFPFHDGRKITRAQAWHQLPNSSKVKKSGRLDVMDVATSDYVSDSKMRVLSVSEIERGSLVFYEFEATEQPLEYSFIELVPATYATKLARIEYRLPEGWMLRSRWLSGTGPEPITNAGVTTWELKDGARMEDEEFADSAVSRWPRLAVALEPNVEQKVPGEVFPNWGAFSDWYTDLASSQFEPTEPVVTETQSIVSKEGVEFAARLDSSASFVRDGVRYVAIEIGIGALKPRPAAETLDSRYGDCKDKAALLAAMLASQGVRSYPILVNASMSGTVADDIPSIGSFNHMILGVSIPEEAALPEHYAHATIIDEHLGRLVVVDTTDEYTSIGALPEYLAARRALLVDGPSGHLITLPGAGGYANRMKLNVNGSFDSTAGTAQIELKAQLDGALARAARAASGDSADARDDYWRTLIADQWPNAVFDEYTLISADEAGSFVESASFRVPLESGKKLRIFPSASFWLPKLNVRRRQLPVVYDFGREIVFDAQLSGVPPDAQLARVVEREIDGLAIKTTMTRDAETLRAHASAKLSKTRFEPSEFRSLRKAYRSLGGIGKVGIYME